MITIGLSRVYLGAHYPYQVGAGYVVGIFSLTTLSLISHLCSDRFNHFLLKEGVRDEILIWFCYGFFIFASGLIAYVIATEQAGFPASYTTTALIQCGKPVIDLREPYWNICSFAGALFGSMLGDSLTRYYVPNTWFKCAGPVSQFIRMILTLGVAIGIVEVWGLESIQKTMGVIVVFKYLARYAVTTFVVFFISPVVSIQVRKCYGYHLEHDLMK